MVSSAGIRNNIVNNNSSCTSVSGINGSDDPNLIDNNNGDPGSQHPRNRWRCMQPRLCNYCWKTFSNSFNLKQHIVNVHIQSQGKFLKNSVKMHKLMILCDFTKFSLHIFRRIMLTMRKSGKKQMVSEETSGYRPWGSPQKSNAK